MTSHTTTTNIQTPLFHQELPSTSDVTLSKRISTSRIPFPPLSSYSLFNMPEPFSWTPTTSLPPPPLQAHTGSSARVPSHKPVFSGPTWMCHPSLTGFNQSSFLRPSSSTFQVELEGCYHRLLLWGDQRKKTWFMLLPFLF
ncbi:unnamed protein product [Cuscuta europaea]|uniref:Uncharacterized protein n=1 Tax=Cuscuta europaea TaxID=41803 RepID=A0A9P0YHL6_CUSEU|nr:unnamed protein product [Cuscuta europaea]